MSEANNGTSYESLSDALSVANDILKPEQKKGGMTIKYVQTSDNKYVQYRLMPDSFSTTISDWQGVDNIPTAGSKNFVESGGVFLNGSILDGKIINSTSKDTLRTTYSDWDVSGILKSDGTVDSAQSGKVSDYIYVKGLKELNHRRLVSSYENFKGLCLYNKNQIFLRSIEVSYDGGVIDNTDFSDATFIRVCSLSTAGKIDLVFNNEIIKLYDQFGCQIKPYYEIVENKYASPDGLADGLNNFDCVKVKSNALSSINTIQWFFDAAGILEVDSNNTILKYQALTGNQGTFVDFTTSEGSAFVYISVSRPNLRNFICKVSIKENENGGEFVASRYIGNRIDRNEIILNKYIGLDGNPVNDSYTAITGLVPLEANTLYYQWRLYPGFYVLYDANMNIIRAKGAPDGSDTDLGNSFITPANTAYGKFTIGSNNSSYVNTTYINNVSGMPNKDLTKLDYMRKNLYGFNKVKELANPCEYDGKECSVFNKILCIGDSLIRGTFNTHSDPTNNIVDEKYGIPAYITKHTGVITTNKGWAGATSIDWWEHFENTDLSGHDACIIHLGTNDAMKRASIEGWINDMKTALSNIIAKVINENNRIKIFLSTCLPAPAYSDRNTNIKAACDAIRELAEDYNYDYIYLADIRAYGHTMEIPAYSAGHLTALGYNRAAMDYVNLISWIIANNSIDFGNVQFVGTEYTDWDGYGI